VVLVYKVKGSGI